MLEPVEQSVARKSSSQFLIESSSIPGNRSGCASIPTWSIITSQRRRFFSVGEYFRFISSFSKNGLTRERDKLTAKNWHRVNDNEAKHRRRRRHCIQNKHFISLFLTDWFSFELWHWNMKWWHLDHREHRRRNPSCIWTKNRRYK